MKRPRKTNSRFEVFVRLPPRVLAPCDRRIRCGRPPFRRDEAQRREPVLQYRNGLMNAE